MQQNNEDRFESIGVNLRELAHRVRQLEKRVDVLDTPWWKKIYFFAMGWNWYTVGRWYGRRQDFWAHHLGNIGKWIHNH